MIFRYLAIFVFCIFLQMTPFSVFAKNKLQNESVFSDSIEAEILNQNQHDLELKKLIQKLLTQNPEIKSLLYKIKAAKAHVSYEASLEDPMIGVEAMNLPLNDLSLNQTSMSGVQVDVSQKIPFPSKLIAQKNAAKAKYNQEILFTKEQINQLIAKFKENYYDYAYSQAAIATYTKNKNRLESLKGSLQAKYSSGTVPLQDPLKIKIAIGEIENSLIEFKQMAQIQKARLNTLLAEEVESPLQIKTNLSSSPLPKNLETLLAKAQKQRPWLGKADFEIEEAKQEHKLAKQGFLPDFDFKASYTFRESVTNDPMSGQDFISGGVSINLPFLWSINRHQKRISESKNLMLEKKSSRQAVSQEVSFQVTQYYAELKQLHSQIKIMKGQIVPTSLAAFNSSKTSYEAGFVDFLDVISSQNSLLTHELNLVRYQYDYEKKHALLEMAVGENLEGL